MASAQVKSVRSHRKSLKSDHVLKIHFLDDEEEKSKTNVFALCSFAELPEYLKFNKYIYTGYRKEFSLRLCLKSIFRVHNETGNIWSHLLGFAYFMYLTIHTLLTTLDDTSIAVKVIFLVYLIGAQIAMFFSALYHTFLCHSEHLCVRVTMLDYIGIGILVVGSYYPPVFFGFHCAPNWRLAYLIGFSVVGLPSVFGPLFEFYHHPNFDRIRLFLMLSTAISGIIPVIHLQFVLPPDEYEGTLWIGLHGRLYLMYLLYFAAVVVYATQFPERFYPGKFDNWFHSHQWWHVLVLLGTSIHFTNCVFAYHRWLRTQDCLDTPFLSSIFDLPSPFSTLGA